MAAIIHRLKKVMGDMDVLYGIENPLWLNIPTELDDFSNDGFVALP